MGIARAPASFRRRWRPGAISLGLSLFSLSLLGACREREARWHYGPLTDPAAHATDESDPSGMDAPAHVERMLGEYGCTACHSFHGERLIGPSLTGLDGRERRFTDGSTAIVNQDYLIESLFQPSKKLVAGYSDVMPSYEGVLDDADAERIAAFLLTLR